MPALFLTAGSDRWLLFTPCLAQVLPKPPRVLNNDGYCPQVLLKDIVQ